MNSINTSELQFITPPQNQGQPVEYSYAVRPTDGPDRIVERRREAGEPDRFFLYVDPEWENPDSSNLDFQNGIPDLGECVLQWEESR